MPPDGGETLQDIAMEYLRGVGGIAQLREFVTIGVPSVILRRLTAGGLAVNPARGIYALKENSHLPFFNYAVEAVSVPPGACICLATAAYLHNLLARDPCELHIALPRGTWPPKSAGQLPVRTVHWKGLSCDGILERPDGGFDPTVTVDIAGREFVLTSPTRTVVDLFAYRRSDMADMELAIEALGNCIRQDVSILELEAFAAQAGIGDTIGPYLAGAGASLNMRN